VEQFFAQLLVTVVRTGCYGALSKLDLKQALRFTSVTLIREAESRDSEDALRLPVEDRRLEFVYDLRQPARIEIALTDVLRHPNPRRPVPDQILSTFTKTAGSALAKHPGRNN